MALYSSATSIDCHRVRFVLAEKGINVEIVDIDSDPSAGEDMAELNPYNEAPTLVDRDLVLYDAGVINDYLDERYPHPPLMPVDPVSRAQFRLALFRIEKDWYSQASLIESAGDKRQAARARKILTESIVASAEVFSIKHSRKIESGGGLADFQQFSAQSELVAFFLCKPSFRYSPFSTIYLIHITFDQTSRQ